MASLAEIRAKLQAAESKGTRSNIVGDNAIYPHWNMEEGQENVISLRFLPDGNPSNPYFWQERAMIKLPFNGMSGDSEHNKQVIVQVPCVEMWNEGCPILAEIRPWFNEPSMVDLGRKYWKKRSYIFQGFVRQNSLADDKTPENPIRRFVMSPQLFTIIKSAIMDTELEELPTDFVRGIDFRISKTTKGGYADYTTSSWARKESAITGEERAAIDKFGLFNLSDFLPKKPGELELKIIKEMFDASVDGQPYDTARWGAYYRPNGITVTNVPAAAVSNAVVEDKVIAPATAPSAPVIESKPATDKAQDILAMIRSRQKTN